MVNARRVPKHWRRAGAAFFATSLLSILSLAFAAQSNPEISSRIAELQTKGFRISSVNGKTTMTLIPGYRFDPKSEPLQQNDYQECVNSTAKLNHQSAATLIQGTNNLLALLECPAGNGGYAHSIIALFEKDNTDQPTCFSRVRLVDNEGYYFWGSANEVHAKKQPNGNFFIAVKLGGGDAGDFWTSSAFLHMDRKCKTTLLTKLYESGHNSYDGCGGHALSHRFVSNSVVQVDRLKLYCPSRTQDNNVPATSRRISRKLVNLSILLKRPRLRTFEP